MTKLIVARFQRNFLPRSKKKGGLKRVWWVGAKGMGMKVVGVLGNKKMVIENPQIFT